MAELVLFVVLLFLPINVTPPIAVWFYEKLLYLSSPLLSVFEAIHIVLVIMKASQMVVDQMEEQPNLVKVGCNLLATVIAP
jgi:ABC-type multidrug transport system permease subunit